MKSSLVLYFIMFSTAYAGGVSGGGGNLISASAPTEKQDPREIRNIILSSQKLLNKFINTKFAIYNSGSMDYDNLKMYSVLFADNENNLHEVMEEIKLDIQLDQPCFDNLGNVFDGSTFNQKKHSICISAFTIAQKCIKNEISTQASALVMHEFSEVVGLSDGEAITLQKQVIAELQ